ncbi:GumC family protein [Devosia sp. RR2S18]|uniref:GumC family protein n=1 Tax=Devosia rhizosphaerae TaxID=3049774 RepID=UPI002541C2D1|nr:AAA family ATPase [Devosia sp. RR2S18]WIJ23920.1 AAA family ATPase [Devosia sp. RR2S18]
MQELVQNWSPSLRQRLLEFLRLDSAEPLSAGEAVTAALQTLREALTVQRVGLTYVVSVQARSPDPERAAELANAVAQAYVDEQLRSKIDNVLSARQIMQEQVADARQNIVASEGAFDLYIESNMARIVADTGRTDLARMQAEIGQLSEARTQSAVRADSLEASLAEDNFAGIVQNLQNQAAIELGQRRQRLSQQITTASPAVALDLEAELASIDEQIRAAAVNEVNALEAQVAQNQEEEQQTRQQLRSAIASSGLSADILTELFDLQQGADLSRQQYQRLLSLERDLATRASLQVADSRIVSPALPSARPVFPNPALILASAGLAAFGLGVLLAFVYENLIGGFTRAEQAEAVLKARMPSAIPRQKGTAAEISAMIVHAPMSAFAEAVRRLRAAIDQWRPPMNASSTAKQSQVIMVTSTEPNEGKTTTAVSLARSYATGGRRVLLIDADLRKPGIHRQVGVDPSMGLLEYLSAAPEDAPEIAAVITSDPLSNATLLLGSNRSGVPTDDLVSLPAFERLIEDSKRTFDIIVVDTPPVGPVVDALYIAPLANTVVFVTKWASTAQRDAKSALDSIRVSAPDAQALVVLNQVSESRLAYRRKYGGYYAQV